MLEDQPIEQQERLFYESGASWYWLIAGPAAAIAMLLIQIKGGVGFQPWVPLIFLVLVTGFLGLQVKAARIHTSVELTRAALRQGAEVTALSDIVRVFPVAEHSVKSREPLEKWQTARALGELSGIPRGRTGIGVELAGKRTAQAWARNHRGLRAALTALVEGETASTP